MFSKPRTQPNTINSYCNVISFSFSKFSETQLHPLLFKYISFCPLFCDGKNLMHWVTDSLFGNWPAEILYMVMYQADGYENFGAQSVHGTYADLYVTFFYIAFRGQMGLSVDEQKKKQEQRLLLNDLRNLEDRTLGCRAQDNFVSCCQSNGVSCCQSNGVGCCQSNGDSFFCQNHVLLERRMDPDVIESEAKLSADDKSSETVISRINRINSGKGASRKFPSMTTWLIGWEQEDTYAALAVVCAAVSVAIAYNCYKQLR